MEITIKRDGLKLYGLLEGTTTIKNDTIAILMHGFKGNLGYDDSKIDFEILQMVRLLKNGEEVKMSKRTGKTVTITELIVLSERASCLNEGIIKPLVSTSLFFVSKP